MEFDIEKKKAIETLRQKVIEGAGSGGNSQRIRLLAYGFMRGVPYSAMEASTNADKHCPLGRETYYSGLVSYVASAARDAFNDSITYELVYDWMRERLEERKVA